MKPIPFTKTLDCCNDNILFHESTDENFQKHWKHAEIFILDSIKVPVDAPIEKMQIIVAGRDSKPKKIVPLNKFTFNENECLWKAPSDFSKFPKSDVLLLSIGSKKGIEVDVNYYLVDKNGEYLK